MTTTTLVGDKLRELAQFEPTLMPVISLYLNAQPDQHGRPRYDAFLKKEFKAKAATFAPNSAERNSFEQDTQKITAWLDSELRPSTNGVAIFACSGERDLFETLQLESPIDQHQMTVGSQPQLYTLARIHDQYPAYAVVIADTNSARILVFGLAATLDSDTVNSPKLSKTQVGGWSQARYQRRVENLHLHHGKEVLEALDKVVRQDSIEHIIFAGDEVILPLLRNHLSPFLADKVVGELTLDINTPEHKVLKASLATMREFDMKTDAEEARSLLNEYRAGGLAAAGRKDVLTALAGGQVDTLFVSTSLGQSLQSADNELEDFITRAEQTGARIRFIEDAWLLGEIGGVGATLRYKV